MGKTNFHIHAQDFAENLETRRKNSNRDKSLDTNVAEYQLACTNRFA